MRLREKVWDVIVLKINLYRLPRDKLTIEVVQPRE
jgi:hypothetical protein